MHRLKHHILVTTLALATVLNAPGTLMASEIAVVRSLDHGSFDQVLKSFHSTCEKRITEYNLKGKKGNADRIVAQIREQKPDLVLAVGLLAANELRDRLPDVPLLYCMVSNPHRYGLTGENIVGISLDIPGAEQFQLYRSVIPDLNRIGVIYDPDKSEQLVSEARSAAEKMGIDLISKPVSSHKKVPGALREMLGNIDVLWMVPDDTVITMDSFRFLLVTSLENKLPMMAVTDIFVKFGALATIVPDPAEVGRQICKIVNAIQHGELDISNVDVLAPTQANLVLNNKTTKKIGLEVSKEVLDTASKVYE